jgi:hypothetical protein
MTDVLIRRGERHREGTTCDHRSRDQNYAAINQGIPGLSEPGRYSQSW